MPILWKMLDGSLRFTLLEEGYLAKERLPNETTDAAVVRLAMKIQAKIPALKDAILSLVKTADMPVSRANRDDWTLKVDGKIDTTSKP